MLFRSLTTAICAACAAYMVFLVLVFSPLQLRHWPKMRPAAPVPVPCVFDRIPPLAVVDVAPGVDPSGVVELLHLRPYEHIAAVNDRALDEDLPAGPQIAELAPPPGGFLDLTVSSPSAERRVLILLHGSPAPGAVKARSESPARSVTRRPYRSGSAP